MALLQEIGDAPQNAIFAAGSFIPTRQFGTTRDIGFFGPKKKGFLHFQRKFYARKVVGNVSNDFYGVETP
jgi:hypothetical protein